MLKDCILLKILPLYNYFYMYKFGLILYQGLTFTMIFSFTRSCASGVESLSDDAARRAGAGDDLSRSASRHEAVELKVGSV